MRTTVLLAVSGLIDLAVSAYGIIERNGFLLAPLVIGAVVIPALLLCGIGRRVYLYVYGVLLGVGLVSNLIPPITSTSVVVIVGTLAAGALLITYL
ncbi:MAG: hypothetical protein QOH26_561, partial [Actinomycetota bacterium]|nr:hypothetical protein [Actinomycetota bacterium]